MYISFQSAWSIVGAFPIVYRANYFYYIHYWWVLDKTQQGWYSIANTVMLQYKYFWSNDSRYSLCKYYVLLKYTRTRVIICTSVFSASGLLVNLVIAFDQPTKVWHWLAYYWYRSILQAVLKSVIALYVWMPRKQNGHPYNAM